MKSGSKLPCELIIWYVLPDLRNEISRTLSNEYHFKQVEIAKALGVTKAAVNQYLSSKRGENFFNLIKNKQQKNLLMREIRKSSQSIVKEQSTIDVELCRLCNIIKRNKIIYKVYEKYAKGVVPNCLIDLEDDLEIISGKKTVKAKMVKCSSCKKDIEEEWVACPYCGGKAVQACPGCGENVNLNWKVCPYCAKKLVKKQSKNSAKKKK